MVLALATRTGVGGIVTIWVRVSIFGGGVGGAATGSGGEGGGDAGGGDDGGDAGGGGDGGVAGGTESLTTESDARDGGVILTVLPDGRKLLRGIVPEGGMFRSGFNVTRNSGIGHLPGTIVLALTAPFERADRPLAPLPTAKDCTEDITGKLGDPVEPLLGETPFVGLVDRSLVREPSGVVGGREVAGIAGLLLTGGLREVDAVPLFPIGTAIFVALRIRFGRPVGTGVQLPASSGSLLFWTVIGGLLN